MTTGNLGPTSTNDGHWRARRDLGSQYKEALVENGIPANSFAVDDVQAEFDRLRSNGVRFTQEPTQMGGVTTAVFDDTCGNLVQIAQLA